MAPILDATWNPGGNANSIFGYDPTLKCQMLDYANFHNYADIWTSQATPGDYDPGSEANDIRTILDGAGNTNIPVWCTETGANGPCANDPTTTPPTVITQADQALYYSANANGSGIGMLSALDTNKCQHVDVFTMNYNIGPPTDNSGTYIGDPHSIACALKAGGYIRFQALSNLSNFLTQQDQGAWAAKAWPAGFGTTGGTLHTWDVGARLVLNPTTTVVSRDVLTRLNLSIGTGGRTRDIGARLNLNRPGMGVRDILSRLRLNPGTKLDISSRLILQGQGLDLPVAVIQLTDSIAQAISDFNSTFVSNSAPAITSLSAILSNVGGTSATSQTLGRILVLAQPLARALLLETIEDVVENISGFQNMIQNPWYFYQQYFPLMDALEIDTGGLAVFLQAYANTLGVYPPSSIVNANFAQVFNAYALSSPLRGYGPGPQIIPNYLVFPNANVDPLYTYVCGQNTTMLYQMQGTTMAPFGGGCAPLSLYMTSAGPPAGGASLTITYIDGTGVTQTGTFAIPTSLVGPSTLTTGSVPLGIVGSSITNVTGTSMTLGESYTIGAPLVRPSSY